MTPDEAQRALYEAGFYSRWEDRRLVGGTHYKPGNPGVFEGKTFSVTLLRLGVCEAQMTDFDQQTTVLREGDQGQQDLGGIVQRIITLLGRDTGEPPKVPLWAAVQLGQVAPHVTSEVEALSTLLWPLGLPEVTQEPPLAGLSEEQRLALPAPNAATRTSSHDTWRPPVVGDTAKAEAREASPSTRRRSYGSGPILNSPHLMRTFHWAPLVAKANWSTRLRPVKCFKPLAMPYETDLIRFMSTTRQILDVLPEWLELIVFSTEPVDGKLTACFLASKADPPEIAKPEWLVALASEGERLFQSTEAKLSGISRR